MAWQDIKKIIALIEKEKRKSKSNSAMSYMIQAVNNLQSAQEEEDAMKEIKEGKYN